MGMAILQLHGLHGSSNKEFISFALHTRAASHYGMIGIRSSPVTVSIQTLVAYSETSIDVFQLHNLSQLHRSKRALDTG
jgi:hypothetical protein